TENQQLRAQVEQMQNELRDTRQKAAEAERLEKLLKLNEPADYHAVTAQVIARDPSLWFDSVTINKGRAAGVEINLPVVMADGFYGRIVSTGPITAQLMLI